MIIWIENNEVLDKYCEIFPYQKELFTNQKTNGFPENYVGVWSWRTIPNINDPSRDYIESEYNAFYQPTQVIILKECTSIEQIVKKLVMGISEKIELPHDFNRIFAKDVFYAIKKTLEAIGYQFVKE